MKSVRTIVWTPAALRAELAALDTPNPPLGTYDQPRTDVYVVKVYISHPELQTGRRGRV